MTTFFLRRRALAVAGLAALGGAAAVRATYPRIGALTYAGAFAVESRLAGLRTRQLHVDGLATTFYEGGPTDRPTIVLLHGYSADRHVWVRFAARLVRDFHVVIPDLAGHGASPFVAGSGYSAPAQAARVAALLDALGVDRAHLLGNSMGGFVAASYAVAYPARTLTLGLCDAAGLTPTEASDADRLFEQGHNPFLLDHVGQFADFYALTMARPPFVPGFVAHAIAADYVRRRASLAEIFGDFYLQDVLDDRLGEITAPTWVVWGAEDRIVHPAHAAVWAEGLRDATVTTYDGVGHMPMVEIAKRCAGDYREFLAAH